MDEAGPGSPWRVRRGRCRCGGTCSPAARAAAPISARTPRILSPAAVNVSEGGSITCSRSFTLPHSLTLTHSPTHAPTLSHTHAPTPSLTFTHSGVGSQTGYGSVWGATCWGPPGCEMSKTIKSFRSMDEAENNRWTNLIIDRRTITDRRTKNNRWTNLDLLGEVSLQ